MADLLGLRCDVDVELSQCQRGGERTGWFTIAGNCIVGPVHEPCPALDDSVFKHVIWPVKLSQTQSLTFVPPNQQRSTCRVDTDDDGYGREKGDDPLAPL